MTTKIATIIECRIETANIWGDCPSIAQLGGLASSGFEFNFTSLKARKLEECEFPEDNGFTIFNPDNENPYVIVWANDSDNELKVSLSDCEKILGISRWLLIDILVDQKSQELEDAIQEKVLARNYEVITSTLEDGKLYDKREKAFP